jgi:hypothetical protein
VLSRRVDDGFGGDALHQGAQLVMLGGGEVSGVRTGPASRPTTRMPALTIDTA